MAEAEKLDPNLERLKAALAGAKNKLTLDSVSELLKPAVAAAKVNPALISALAKYIDETPVVQAVILRTVLKVAQKGMKFGTTKEEVMETAEPFFLMTEQEREALGNIHALFKIHKALALLLGENYCTSRSKEELLTAAGLTKEELKALTPFEVFQRLLNAPNPPKPYIDSLRDAADLLFEERFGWEPGTAKSLTLPELWLALEHALEDKPNDPKGIWRLSS
jgi:hypothetical protein